MGWDFPHLFPSFSCRSLQQGRKRIAPRTSHWPLWESACKQGWKSLTLHLMELWKHGLLLNPAQLAVSGQESELSVFTLGIVKKKGKEKKNQWREGKTMKPVLTRSISIAVHVSVRSWLSRGYAPAVLSHRTTDQCYQEFPCWQTLSASWISSRMSSLQEEMFLSHSCYRQVPKDPSPGWNDSNTFLVAPQRAQPWGRVGPSQPSPPDSHEVPLQLLRALGCHQPVLPPNIICQETLPLAPVLPRCMWLSYLASMFAVARMSLFF